MQYYIHLQHYKTEIHPVDCVYTIFNFLFFFNDLKGLQQTVEPLAASTTSINNFVSIIYSGQD